MNGTPLVALVGNPNAGKTSLFNALTGAAQHVANYPGVTVERISGRLKLADETVDIVDIPGLYSMKAVSVDEEVAAGAITGAVDQKPDLLVCVMDATNLQRSLFFYSQLADLERPTLVAMTMMDAIRKHGESVDIDALQSMLGCPVVPVIAHKSQGLDNLRTAISQAIKESSNLAPIGRDLTTEERYKWSSEVVESVFKPAASPRPSRTQKIDQILTHRVFGLIIFTLIMYVVFQSIYTMARPIMAAIQWLFASIGNAIGPMLKGVPWLQSMVVDGILNGVGTVAGFLPQILILFFFIAALEGTGYMARAAFMMDRLLGWAGLSGRAFIPLISSFACAIPGIMAARVMPDAKSRLATILVAPLMSCSARLPVYILLIGAFIEPRFGPGWAGFALFGMHFVGLIVAIPVVLVLNKRVIKSKRLPFIMELPRYQWPKWRDVWLTMLTRARIFVQTAGTIIVVMSLLIWALLYFPRSSETDHQYAVEYSGLPADVKGRLSLESFVDERHTEESYLGRFGKVIEPVFKPAGFDWRISTAILCAFPAREVVVSSMGILFAQGKDVKAGSRDLNVALQKATWPDGKPLFTNWTAVGLMVFFALCCQCMATLATVKRETNSWGWPIFMFSYMTALAYIFAVLIHRAELHFMG